MKGNEMATRKSKKKYRREPVVPGSAAMRRTTSWVDADLDKALSDKAASMGVSRAALIRFALEPWRGDPTVHVGPLTLVQVVCLAAVVVFTALILHGERAIVAPRARP